MKLPILLPPEPSEGVVRLPIADRPLERADAARNRERILVAARALLGRRSIAEICMDEVARAAGVGKGTLYRRFADRSSLCRALLDESERALQNTVIRGFDLPRGTPAIRRLGVLFDALVGFTLENAALLAEAEAFARGQEGRYDIAVFTWRRRELERLSALAHAEGDLPAIDVALAADLVIAGLDPDLMRHHLAQAGGDEAALRVRYVACFARSFGLSADRAAALSDDVRGR